MPLRLSIGLSKKVGEPNYGSRGASVSLEAEFDAALTDDPERLRGHVRRLFGLARTSLDEELKAGSASKKAPPPAENRTSPSANDNTNRGPAPAGKKSPARAATGSQVRALYAIAKRCGVDLTQILRERFRVGRAEELGIREASQLIDELQAEATAEAA